MNLTDKKLKRMIEIQLGITGNSKEAADIIKTLIGRFRALGAAATTDMATATQRMGLLTRAIRAANPDLLKFAKAQDAVARSGKDVVESAKNVGAAMRNILPFLAAAGAEGFGFVKSLRYVTDFNKQLLLIGSQFSKYGVGIGTVEDKLGKMARQTTLTRESTLRLLSAYEKGFNFISLTRGEKIMMNLKGAVGANADAMQDLQNSLSAVVQKFPDLEDSITRLDSSDRKRLATQSRILALTGQITYAEAKRIREYARQNEQAESLDDKRKKAIEAEVEAMNKMRAAAERIELAIGKALSPFAEKFADYIDRGADGLEKWIPVLTKIGLALVAIKGSLLTIQAMRAFGGSVMGAGGSMLYNRNAPALSGALPNTKQFLGSAVKGTIAGYATGQVYEGAYQAATGRELLNDNSNAGMANRAGKIGAMAGAGYAFGGPVGMVAGAGVGMYQEVSNSLDYINKVRKEGLEAEKQSIIALTNLTSKFHSKVLSASTPEEAKYNSNLENAAKIRQNAKEYFVKHDKRPSLNPFAQVGLDDHQKEVYNKKLARAHALEIQAYESSYAKAKEDQSEKMSAANAAASAAVPSTGGQTANAINSIALLEKFHAPENVVAGFYKNTFERIEKQMDDIPVANKLSKFEEHPDEAKKLGITKDMMTGGPMAAGGNDFRKLEVAYDRTKEKMSGEDANSEEYKKQSAILAIIDGQLKERSRMQAPFLSMQEHISAVMNETAITAEHAVKLYDAQKSVLGSMVDKFYVTGEGDFGDLEKQATSAKESYQIALAAQSQILANATALQELDKKQATKQLDDLEKKEAMLPHGSKERDDVSKEVAGARMRVYAAASELASLQGKEILVNNQIQKAAKETELGTMRLQIDEKRVEASRTLTAKLESQLALETQYGNSNAKNFETTVGILKTREDTISLLEKELADITSLRKGNEANVEYQQRELKVVTQINQLRGQQLQTLRDVANLNRTNVEYASAEADQAQAMIDLVDNLGMGVQASATMRMQAANAIGRQIEQEKMNLGNLDSALDRQKARINELANAGADDATLKGEKDQLLSIETEHLKKQTAITRLMQQQATITKSIRDGYVSAIQAMTTGTGIFAKFMFTQDKNLGVMLQNIKGVPQGMRSGGFDTSGKRSVGQRDFAQFQIGGISGRRDDSAQWDTYNGGPAIAKNIQGTQSNIFKNVRNYLQNQISHAGSAMALGFGASPNRGALQNDSTLTPGVKKIEEPTSIWKTFSDTVFGKSPKPVHSDQEQPTQPQSSVWKILYDALPGRKTSTKLDAQSSAIPGYTDDLTKPQTKDTPDRKIFRAQLKTQNDILHHLQNQSKPSSSVVMSGGMDEQKNVLDGIARNGSGTGGVTYAANGMATRSRMTPSHYPTAGDVHPVMVNSGEMILAPHQHKAIARMLDTDSTGLLSFHDGKIPRAANGMAPVGSQMTDYAKVNFADWKKDRDKQQQLPPADFGNDTTASATSNIDSIDLYRERKQSAVSNTPKGNPATTIANVPQSIDDEIISEQNRLNSQLNEYSVQQEKENSGNFPDEVGHAKEMRRATMQMQYHLDLLKQTRNANMASQKAIVTETPKAEIANNQPLPQQKELKLFAKNKLIDLGSGVEAFAGAISTSISDRIIARNKIRDKNRARANEEKVTKAFTYGTKEFDQLIQYADNDELRELTMRRRREGKVADIPITSDDEVQYWTRREEDLLRIHEQQTNPKSPKYLNSKTVEGVFQVQHRRIRQQLDAAKQRNEYGKGPAKNAAASIADITGDTLKNAGDMVATGVAYPIVRAETALVKPGEYLRDKKAEFIEKKKASSTASASLSVIPGLGDMFYDTAYGAIAGRTTSGQTLTTSERVGSGAGFVAAATPIAIKGLRLVAPELATAAIPKISLPVDRIAKSLNLPGEQAKQLQLQNIYENRIADVVLRQQRNAKIRRSVDVFKDWLGGEGATSPKSIAEAAKGIPQFVAGKTAEMFQLVKAKAIKSEVSPYELKPVLSDAKTNTKSATLDVVEKPQAAQTLPAARPPVGSYEILKDYSPSPSHTTFDAKGNYSATSFKQKMMNDGFGSSRFEKAFGEARKQLEELSGQMMPMGTFKIHGKTKDWFVTHGISPDGRAAITHVGPAEAPSSYHTGGNVIAGPEGKEMRVLAGEGIYGIKSISQMKGTMSDHKPVTVTDAMKNSKSEHSHKHGGTQFHFHIDTSELAKIPDMVQSKIDQLQDALSGDGQVTSGKTFGRYGR